MEARGFLGGPPQAGILNILSWNINGVKTKLEKKIVHDLLSKYDIVSLNEVKTPLSVSFPGFVSYKSSVRGSPHRGGTVVLIKNYLTNLIAKVDTCIDDQIWLQLRNAPKMLFCFCYIPPSDSEYYSHTSFSAIQETIKSTEINSEYQNQCLVLGDLNARFGKSARELPNTIP